MGKKPTAGERIGRRLGGKQRDEATPHELSEKMLAESFEEQMNEWVNAAKNTFKGDFYIVLNLKLEKSLDNAPHLIPEARQTCPDPFYDQSVWHYHRHEDRLEFLWTIPDIGTTKLFKDDPLNCPADQVQLRGFVLDYCDGTLQKKADSLNKEH